jgi:hypothetical protein
MTAPIARVRAVAGWDVPLAGRAVAVLAEAAERLSPWRARLEGIGRALEAGASWSGPAALSAAAALADVAAVAWAVGRAVDESVSAYRRLAAEADRAQELALQALASEDPSTADAALLHAARAGAAAEDAGDALAGLGVRDAFGPADFHDLLAFVPVMGPVQAPPLPPPRSPAVTAEWWAGLSTAQQRALIGTAPAIVGACDGIPAWARDRANRLLLRRALADPATPDGARATARAVAVRITGEEAAGRDVQLHLLDLAGDRVALAFGDLDTADAVALVVPGIFNTAADDLVGLTGDAVDLAAATRAAGHGTTVAAVVWLGYRTPANLAQAAFRGHAERGGRALAGALDGLAAARRSVGTPAPRTTVVAHSYGTYVVDEAADEPGTLAADAVVLLGSPGMEDDAASLEVPVVFDAATPGDPITYATWFGELKTWEAGYGSTALPTDLLEGHSEYFDRDRPTLAAMGEVVAGTRHPR